VEFSLIVPLFLLILLGMIEYGFVFTHDLTVEYATREGARAGAALANGGGTLGCGAGQSPNWTTVDPLVIAAVERVLTSPGSQVVISRVSKIVIYKANPTTGADDQGYREVWTDPSGTGNFVQQPGSSNWKACSRSNAAPTPDSLGVSLTYTYNFVTPLAAVLGFFGGGNPTLTLTDRTVMLLEPTTN
jgi:TadE-like protein